MVSKAKSKPHDMNIITWQFVGVHKAHDAEIGLLDLRSHRSNIQTFRDQLHIII
jgi:hypothetical protein